MRTTSKPHSCNSVHKIMITSALSEQLTSLVPSSAAFIILLVVQAQFSDFKSNLQRNLHKQILQSEVSKLFAALANCSEHVDNQNTNVAVKACKVAKKRISGLVICFDLFHV